VPTYKAAPLQALGIRKPVRHSQAFEDENDKREPRNYNRTQKLFR
jgi:hypothetical protein